MQVVLLSSLLPTIHVHIYCCLSNVLLWWNFPGSYDFSEHLQKEDTLCINMNAVCNVTEYSKNTLVKICFIECLYRNTRSTMHHVKKGEKNKQLPGIEPRVPNLSYQCSVWADGCMVVILWWPVYSKLKPGTPHWFNSH